MVSKQMAQVSVSPLASILVQKMIVSLIIKLKKLCNKY